MASSALLKLTQDNNESSNGNSNQSTTQKEQINRDSVYIILDQVNKILGLCFFGLILNLNLPTL